MVYTEQENEVILRVRLSPNSSSCVVRGVFRDENDDEFLKVNVVSVPEKGKANKELVKFLSGVLKVAKSDIKIVSGELDRYKKLAIYKSFGLIEKVDSLIKEFEVVDGGKDN